MDHRNIEYKTYYEQGSDYHWKWLEYGKLHHVGYLYTLQPFKNEIESAGFKICSYSIQFGEIWAIVEKIEGI